MRTDKRPNAQLANTKLTPENHKLFVWLVSRGNYYDTVCKLVGVSYRVFHIWMEIGENETDENSRYRRFYLDVQAATAAAEMFVVDRWMSHLDRDWRACATFLARRYPDRWARRSRSLDTVIERELEAMFKEVRNRVSASAFDELLNAFAEVAEERNAERNEIGDVTPREISMPGIATDDTDD